MRTKIAVVIPTAQRQDLLRECLGSLERQSFTDFETILVADGAGSWAEELAGQHGCRLLRMPGNRGFAAAVNRGVAASQAEYAMVLNDDVQLHQDWLRIASSFLDERPEFAFCCGKIRHAGELTIDNAGDAVSLAGSAWRLGHGRKDSKEFDLPRPIFTFPGTAALVRKSVFERMGGLDEDFFAYLEDIDFSLRAARQGYRGYYLPQAASAHWGGATSGGPDSPAVFCLQTKNQLMILAKNYPWRLWVRLGPRIAWAQMLWFAMAVRKNMLGAYISGISRFIRLLPKTIRKRQPWQAAETNELLLRLRTSEEEIYSDVFAPDRTQRDTFWRMYFYIFPPRRCKQPAAKPGLGSLPIP